MEILGNDLRLLKEFRERSKTGMQEDKEEKKPQTRESVKKMVERSEGTKLEEITEKNEGPRRSGRKRRPSEKARER
ncbi:hypothetical protein L211DRAFT_835576 [Terfezia boudieri ATCC MYA-4762]|uniref:Uncharacterized protein n=1 Tax=Terfezia boudieri ATCC MYA-4762 TaxID=1051890 RepID=A0A3N4LTK2_9PEZI|nr:hypothetical protein L211DRAFT_835575 [Terfezia boudieri ATCC MYA-4762]RPB26207.1 hypothetical protein L211DRAFT_835576 [Terfezia boudieri ATCC MYA-4762]